MKYPKKSHYLRFRKKDRYTSYVLDYRGGSLYEMDICCARFLRSLNGCRDPYKNTKGLTEEEAEKPWSILKNWAFWMTGSGSGSRDLGVSHGPW